MSDLLNILDAIPLWFFIGMIGGGMFVLHSIYAHLWGPKPKNPRVAVIEEVAHALEGQVHGVEVTGRGAIGEVRAGGLEATIDIQAWTQKRGKTQQSFCSAEVKVPMTTLPDWFVFDVNEGAWSMTLGHHRIMALQDELLNGLMSDGARAGLLMLIGSGHIDSKGGHMSVTLEASILSSHDLFVEHITDFIRALIDIETSLPKTLQDVDEFVAARTKDESLLLGLYDRAVSGMSTNERARKMVQEAVEHRASGALVVNLVDKHTKALQETIAQAKWEPTRHLEVFEAAFVHKHLNPSVRGRIAQKVFDAVPLEALTPQLVKRTAGAIFPFLRHHWGTPGARAQVLAVADTLIPWMPGTDAARWLVLFTRDAPELCTYERFGAVLKHKMPPTQRARLVPAIEAVLAAQPQALDDERWFKRTLGMLQFASEAEIARITPSLLAHVHPKHLSMVREFQDDHRLQSHPMQHAVGALMSALERQMAGAGALSMSAADTQEGQLTSVAEAAALSASK